MVGRAQRDDPARIMCVNTSHELLQRCFCVSGVCHRCSLYHLTRHKISDRWRERARLRVRGCSHRKLELGAASGSLHRLVRPAYRSSFRIISFSPDQTSSTAQTFISTSPSGKAIWRTTSSVTSVATPELFFGQDTHIIPAGSIANRNDSSLAFNVDLDDANKCIKVTLLLTRFA